MWSSLGKRAEATTEEVPGGAAGVLHVERPMAQGSAFVSGHPGLLQPLFGLWM